MIVCPWRKKYEGDIVREERLAAKFSPMNGPNGPQPNYHAEAAQRARDNLHKLSIDHRMGGCICQAAPYGTFKS